MRQDIGEFGADELVKEIAIYYTGRGLRTLAEKLVQVADACRVDCQRCEGTGICRCVDCERTPEFKVDCLICNGTGKVDP